MRLIDADKLPYEDIDSIDGNTYMCVNAYDIEHAPTIEQSEDCVSREEALLALTGMDLPTDIDKLIALFTKRIQHLPSVTPQPKIGHWIAIHNESDDTHTIKCSCCDYTLVTVLNRNYTKKEALDSTRNETKNYCPNCGADMRESEDETPRNNLETSLDNATNGDIIKTLFPSAKFENAVPFTDGRWETMNLNDNQDRPAQLRTYADWWNAPYKRGDIDANSN